MSMVLWWLILILLRWPPAVLIMERAIGSVALLLRLRMRNLDDIGELAGRSTVIAVLLRHTRPVGRWV